jgi:splicing factor 3B subunit 4
LLTIKYPSRPIVYPPNIIQISKNTKEMANIAQVYERNQEATLYIGNCEEQVTEELVWELFLQCGPVVSVQMPKDKVTGQHNGYGFVEFKSEEDADYAIKIMHMTKLYSKPIKVNKASQDKRTQEVGANIWVGNLSEDVDEKTLYDTFNSFGLILSTKIARDAETGESKGHGFVSYDSFEAADAAIKAMDGQYFSNRTVRVHFAFKKDSKGEKHGSAAERLLAANRPIMARPGFFGNNQDSSHRNQRSLILPSSLVTSHNSHLLSTENPVIKIDGLNKPSVATGHLKGEGTNQVQ